MVSAKEIPMSKLAASLASNIDDNPEAPQNVIVRVEGDVDTYEEQLTLHGFMIRRKLRLINGFAATAPGSRVQELANEPWVTSIEQDQQVQAL
jgi:peptidase inhibitor I9